MHCKNNTNTLFVSKDIARMEADAVLDYEEEGIVGGGDSALSIGDGVDIDDNEIQDLPNAHEEIRTFEEIKREQLAKLDELKQAQHMKESEDKGNIIRIHYNVVSYPNF